MVSAVPFGDHRPYVRPWIQVVVEALSVAGPDGGGHAQVAEMWEELRAAKAADGASVVGLPPLGAGSSLESGRRCLGSTAGMSGVVEGRCERCGGVGWSWEWDMRWQSCWTRVMCGACFGRGVVKRSVSLMARRRPGTEGL